MNTILILLGALVLDFIFGDPAKLWARHPHPVTIMGRMIHWCDTRLNSGGARKIKGIIAIAILTLAAFILGTIFWLLPNSGILGWGFGIIEMAIVAILIAHKSLVDHVREVASALSETLPAGRHAVSAIVGRDVSKLDESGVARAAIESGAENFSDGVIAPAFWYLIFGVPGILAYKMVNTADSMIGYQNERYEDFGFGAARLDDLMNWVPARLAGCLICLATLSRPAFEIMQRDADLHNSPNAGWPEAAMAGTLNIALAGPRNYGGVVTKDLFINRDGRQDIGAAEITQSLSVLNKSWSVFAGIIAVPALLLWLF